MGNIEISIIIATYNADRTLERCLLSIIPQITNECELIIIDGGSRDTTPALIEQYKKNISYTISERDEGVYDAWNKGLRKSCGKWIMFVGADDILCQSAIQRYLSFIKNSLVEYDFISGRIESIAQDGKFIAYTGKRWDFEKCCINMDVTHVASLTNRKLFDEVGLFDIRYKICGDYQFLLRKGRTLNAAFINEVIAKMPIGGISFSQKALKEQIKAKHETAKISWVLCYSIYLFQLLLFYSYRLRHLLDKKKRE